VGDATTPSPSLAIVIPMFNEECGAERCVRAVCAAVHQLPTRAVLIVVDDGSTDATPGILARLRSEGNAFTTVTHERNRGYGEALRTGARSAAADGYDYVLFMDSDLTNDPASLPLFLQKMREGCDVIKASRYARGGGVVGVPAWKVGISFLGNRIARFLFRLPLTDSTNGFRALRTEIFRRLEITEPGFASIMQEIHQAKRLTRSFC
jgi:glycosyltransferase involved in cell wall biosynthesis